MKAACPLFPPGMIGRVTNLIFVCELNPAIDDNIDVLDPLFDERRQDLSAAEYKLFYHFGRRASEIAAYALR
jgi:hypothetical protein